MRRAGYLAATLLLAIAGVVAAFLGGHAGPAAAAGAGCAWIVQAISFWFLAGGLERAVPVLHVWVAGIAARLGVGLLIWLLAALAGAPTRVLMIAYGLSLVAFLLLEAVWLAFVGPDRAAGGE